MKNYRHRKTCLKIIIVKSTAILIMMQFLRLQICIKQIFNLYHNLCSQKDLNRASITCINVVYFAVMIYVKIRGLIPSHGQSHGRTIFLPGKFMAWPLGCEYHCRHTTRNQIYLGGRNPPRNIGKPPR